MVESTEQEQTKFDFSTHKFVTPSKTLETLEHVTKFRESQGCKELMAFIGALQTSCKSTRMTQTAMTDVSKL